MGRQQRVLSTSLLDLAAATPRPAHPALPSQGTLLLNNIHKAPKAVLPLIKSTVDSVSRGSMDDGEAG